MRAPTANLVDPNEIHWSLVFNALGRPLLDCIMQATRPSLVRLKFAHGRQGRDMLIPFQTYAVEWRLMLGSQMK